MDLNNYLELQGEKYVCESIYNNLHQIFKYNQQNNYKKHELLFFMKNMKNFDMKKCVEYSSIPNEITSINQTFIKRNYYLPYNTEYFLSLENGKLDMIYVLQ